MPSNLVRIREEAEDKGKVELKTLMPKLNNLKILYENYSSPLSLPPTAYTQII